MYLLIIALFSIAYPIGNVAGFHQTKLNEIKHHQSWKYLPTDVCGTTRFDNFTGRIVGGEEAKLGEFPFICLLGFRSKLLGIEPDFTCGCALISKYYVITAGHCGVENNVVRLGENDQTTDIDCQGDTCAPRVQDIQIKKYLFDLYGNYPESQNDINLILLDKPAEFNDFVIPICLPRGNVLTKNLMGRHVKTAGWGLTNSSDETSTSTRLMYMTAPVVHNEECNKLYRRTLLDSQYCVGYKRGIDSCNGDSGGPMFKSIRIGKERRIYLLGITSYGLVNCGHGQGVYTKITSFMSEILDRITQ